MVIEAQQDGDLSAMVSGMHEEMSEDVFNGAGPGFTLAVHVLDRFA